jgi:hypothetical protein
MTFTGKALRHPDAERRRLALAIEPPPDRDARRTVNLLVAGACAVAGLGMALVAWWGQS